MLNDGLYELHYRNERVCGSSNESLLLVLRMGNILGSDRWGGVFLGHCVYDAARRRHKINVRLQVPPGGMLITGGSPHPDGCVIAIEAEFDETADRGTGVVDVAGQPVRIELMYMGPVPGQAPPLDGSASRHGSATCTPFETK